MKIRLPETRPLGGFSPKRHHWDKGAESMTKKTHVKPGYPSRTEPMAMKTLSQQVKEALTVLSGTPDDDPLRLVAPSLSQPCLGDCSQASLASVPPAGHVHSLCCSCSLPPSSQTFPWLAPGPSGRGLRSLFHPGDERTPSTRSLRMILLLSHRPSQCLILYISTVNIFRLISLVY